MQVRLVQKEQCVTPARACCRRRRWRRVWRGRRDRLVGLAGASRGRAQRRPMRCGDRRTLLGESRRRKRTSQEAGQSAHTSSTPAPGRSSASDWLASASMIGPANSSLGGSAASSAGRRARPRRAAGRDAFRCARHPRRRCGSGRSRPRAAAARQEDQCARDAARPTACRLTTCSSRCCSAVRIRCGMPFLLPTTPAIIRATLFMSTCLE